MFVISKQNELFTSTLDRIPIRLLVLDESFTIVVLNAKFALLLAAHANRKDGENRRSPTTVPYFAS